MHKYRKWKQVLAMTAALLLTLIQGTAVHAAGISITLQTPLEGFPYRIYKVGEVKDDGKYVLQEDFADSSVNMNIETADDAAKAARALSGYADAQGIQPDISGQASEGGTAAIELEEDAVYLLREESHKADGTTYRSSAGLFIPGQIEADADGIRPLLIKYESEPVIEEKQVTYTIRKVWDDKEGSSRPGSITVSILQNGKIYDTVTLSVDNNWSDSFTVLDDGSIFSVLENSVPEGYVFSVEQRNGIFVITNTYEGTSDSGKEPTETEPPKTETPQTSATPSKTESHATSGITQGGAPKTGDVSLLGPILLAASGGIVLLVSGFALARSKKDED